MSTHAMVTACTELITCYIIYTAVVIGASSLLVTNTGPGLVQT